MRYAHSFLALALTTSLLATACSSEAEPAAEAEAPAVVMAAAPACVLTAPLEEAEARPSPLRQLEFAVGGNSARLCYGAPSANGRVVVGGEFVPVGSPWRAGANEPTTLHLTGEANVGGIALQPGAYSIYMIAGETEWQVHINANTDRWGIPISPEVQAADVGSFAVAPETIEEMVETLRYRWEAGEGAAMGMLIMEWEHTRVSIHVM